jgi:hypothetical protein
MIQKRKTQKVFESLLIVPKIEMISLCDVENTYCGYRHIVILTGHPLIIHKFQSFLEGRHIYVRFNLKCESKICIP